MTADQLQASRAILYWAAKTRRMLWREYNALMRDVRDREWRLIGCNGKETFETFAAAEAIAKHRCGKDGHRTRKPYHCSFCGKFHVAPIDRRTKTIRLRLKEKREVAYG